jgi:hypothetical protein
MLVYKTLEIALVGRGVDKYRKHLTFSGDTMFYISS